MAVTAGLLAWSECYLPDVYGRYRSRAQRSTQKFFANDRHLAHASWMSRST